MRGVTIKDKSYMPYYYICHVCYTYIHTYNIQITCHMSQYMIIHHRLQYMIIHIQRGGGEFFLKLIYPPHIVLYMRTNACRL
jgi:hypothetical protein